jgi:threonine dehydratase
MVASVVVSRPTRVETWTRSERTLLLKREDLNETGSHKIRAARHQVCIFHEEGAKALVLSSSGNGAKASSHAAQDVGLPVYSFLSPRTPRSKVESILAHGGRPILSDRPVNLAKYVARHFKIPNLRPSTCEHAVCGFRSLGEEIVAALGADKSKPAFDSVFIFSSSGTSLLGIAQELSKVDGAPSLHPVQAGEICPLVESDEVAWRRGQAPRTGALCAKKTARSQTVRGMVQLLKGRGWIVTDAEVDEAQTELWDSGRMVSREAAAALSAADRGLNEGEVQRPLVVLTGAALCSPEPCGLDIPEGVVVLNEYLETRNYFLKEAEKWA